MQVMGNEEQLIFAVHWLDLNLSFDLDARVHVFELTIRALGVHLGHLVLGLPVDFLMRNLSVVGSHEKQGWLSYLDG